MPTINVRVAAAADGKNFDDWPGGNYSYDIVNIAWVVADIYGGSYESGDYYDRSSHLLRFVSPALADLASATITSATLRYRYSLTRASVDGTAVGIYGWRQNNSPPYSGSLFPPTDYDLTAPVLWTSFPAGVVGDYIDTPDITAVLEELAAGGFLAAGVVSLLVSPILPDAFAAAVSRSFSGFSNSDPVAWRPELIVEYEVASATVHDAAASLTVDAATPDTTLDASATREALIDASLSADATAPDITLDASASVVERHARQVALNGSPHTVAVTGSAREAITLEGSQT